MCYLLGFGAPRYLGRRRTRAGGVAVVVATRPSGAILLVILVWWEPVQQPPRARPGPGEVAQGVSRFVLGPPRNDALSGEPPPRRCLEPKAPAEGPEARNLLRDSSDRQSSQQRADERHSTERGPKTPAAPAGAHVETPGAATTAARAAAAAGAEGSHSSTWRWPQPAEGEAGAVLRGPPTHDDQQPRYQ